MATSQRLKCIPLLLAIPFAGGAQTLVNNGATITISAGGSLHVNGSFTNTAGSAVNNSGELNISGNTINNGSVNATTAGSLVLDGTIQQTLGGSSPLVVRDLTVNNAAGVVLGTSLRVDGVANFTNGVIVATNSAAPVIFSSGASIGAAPSNASHVNGYVRKEGAGAFTYPTGDGSRYQPVGTGLSANSAGMTARYYPADAGTAPFGNGGSSSTPLLYYNKLEYWDLVPAGTATGTVTIYYDGYNNTGISNSSDLRVAHKSGGSWLNEGGTVTGTVAAGSLTSNSISSFSPFTLGSISVASALPLVLLSFEGRAERGVNRLEWIAAGTGNESAFELQRSGDGRRFEHIRTIACADSTSRYMATDRDAPALAYYRLRYIGAGGAWTYSSIISISSSGQPDAVTVFPVPAGNRLTIRCRDPRLEGSEATLVDLAGKAVRHCTLGAGQSAIDLEGLAPGQYTLQLADEGGIRIIKK